MGICTSVYISLSLPELKFTFRCLQWCECSLLSVIASSVSQVSVEGILNKKHNMDLEQDSITDAIAVNSLIEGIYLEGIADPVFVSQDYDLRHR